MAWGLKHACMCVCKCSLLSMMQFSCVLFRQDYFAFDGDYAKIGRQIQSSFERAVQFHAWNAGMVQWNHMD